MTHWVRLADGREGCVVVQSAAGYDEKLSLKAYVEKELGVEVITMKTLPYAASPLLLGSDMTFCYDPGGCAGHSSCPKARSCCD